MHVFSAVVSRLTTYMAAVAGAVLVVMMAITMTDVVLRIFGRPIVGAYELVAFLGVAVAAFALPRASLLKAHVYVDLVIDKVSGRSRRLLRIATRVLVFIFFLIASFYFVFMARNFVGTNTVTMTLKVPFYPVVFGLAAGSLVQCLISVLEILSEAGGQNE